MNRLRPLCWSLLCCAMWAPALWAARTDPTQDALDAFLASPGDEARKQILLQSGQEGLMAIGRFVFAPTPTSDQRARIEALGLQMRRGDFRTREQAQRDLASEGELAREAIEALIESDDPELGTRARSILSAIERSGYSRSPERIASLGALHQLLLHDWPMEDLRTGYRGVFRMASDVPRFTHPLQREILAVYMASLLSGSADVDSLLKAAHQDGPAAGVAVRVLYGGLDHLVSPSFPSRWGELSLPDPDVVTVALVKTHNAEVARALLWGVDNNGMLDALRVARGKDRSHEWPKVAYVYNKMLWHSSRDGRGKAYILAVYNDLARGPEALMHLWARAGAGAKTDILGHINWKMEPKVVQLMDALLLADRKPADADPRKASNVDLQDLYVWRSPVPGPSAWYQTTDLEPLEGQAMPEPSAAREGAESDYFGVVHFSGLAPGAYRLRIHSGTTSVTREVDLRHGVHALFWPLPKMHSTPMPVGLSSAGFGRRYAMRVGIGPDFGDPVVARLRYTEAAADFQIDTFARFPGELSFRNFSKGSYRIEIHAEAGGTVFESGPGGLVLPLPLPLDVTFNATLHPLHGRVIGLDPEAADRVIVLRSHVSMPSVGLLKFQREASARCWASSSPVSRKKTTSCSSSAAWICWITASSGSRRSTPRISAPI